MFRDRVHVVGTFIPFTGGTKTLGESNIQKEWKVQETDVRRDKGVLVTKS